MGYAYFICPLALVAVAVAFWIWPPKKINMTYGYRTTRSMKSQSAWDFAQKYSAKWMNGLGGMRSSANCGSNPGNRDDRAGAAKTIWVMKVPEQ